MVAMMKMRLLVMAVLIRMMMMMVMMVMLRKIPTTKVADCPNTSCWGTVRFVMDREPQPGQFVLILARGRRSRRSARGRRSRRSARGRRFWRNRMHVLRKVRFMYMVYSRYK